MELRLFDVAGCWSLTMTSDSSTLDKAEGLELTTEWDPSWWLLPGGQLAVRTFTNRSTVFGVPFDSVWECDI